MADKYVMQPGDSYEGQGSELAQEPSMWSRIGDWASNNKDLLFAAALEANKYGNAKAAADAQNILNQTYSKWSGFNPSLMQMVKPVRQPDIAVSILDTIKGGPVAWQDMADLYQARKEGNLAEYLKRQKNEEALRAGLAAGAK